MAQAAQDASAQPAQAPDQLAPAPAAPPAAGGARAREPSGRSRFAATSASSRRRFASYANLSPGQTYTAETLDQALKDLYATQLFADVTITGAETGDLVIAGHAKTRSSTASSSTATSASRTTRSCPRSSLRRGRSSPARRARSDVDRILELYRRQGRFAARVEPKIVQLDQNRVDVVFEIYEGDLAKVRKINIIGNKAFPTSGSSRRCTRARPAACSASSSRTTPTIRIASPPTSRSSARSI